MQSYYKVSQLKVYIFVTDVLIGAPYEDDGQGAVYMYLGHSLGIHSSPSQRIAPADFGPGLFGTQGFGYSITTGMDVDNNRYPGTFVNICK